MIQQESRLNVADNRASQRSIVYPCVRATADRIMQKMATK